MSGNKQNKRFYIVLSFGDYPVRFKWYDLSLLQHPRRMKLYFACRAAKTLLLNAFALRLANNIIEERAAFVNKNKAV